MEPSANAGPESEQGRQQDTEQTRQKLELQYISVMC